uniref:YqaJ viral recombinase domain-containing protein n=1 Tax=viral metagenome TaxID=1070528 RepID=A0A6C0H538_9ZZZZ
MEFAIYEFINEYATKLHPNIISYPDYIEIIINHTREVLFNYNKNLNNDEKMYWENKIEELVNNYFMLEYRPKRHLENFEENRQIEAKDRINKLIIKSNSNEQKTDEWYEIRHNLLTASNIYKVFGSESVKNQLIYEKCMPVKTNQMNAKSVLWGTKYEAISVMIYERIYKTKIANMGCVIHSKYPFLGASPDGINSDPKSDLFGVLIEIKNVVSREITGIPKMEYWIQMQIQMECCDLDYCHFIETKFLEYSSEEEYMSDEMTEYKGTIIQNHKGEYVYELCSKRDELLMKEILDDIGLLYNQTNLIINKCELLVDKNRALMNKTKDILKNNKFLFNKTKEILEKKMEQSKKNMRIEKEELMDIEEENENRMIIEDNETMVEECRVIDLTKEKTFWKLEKINCVVVERNRLWFEKNIEEIEKIWNIIQTEKKNDYSHRKPQKKIKNNILFD